MVLNLKGDIDDSKNFTQKIMKPVTKKIPKILIITQQHA